MDAASAQKILADVGATLASSLDADDILSTVARQIGEVMDVWSCDIWDYDASQKRLTYAATWARELKPNDLDYVGTTYTIDQYESFRPNVEQRALTEEHIDDPDLPEEDRIAFEKWGEKSALDAPLIYGDDVIGVLGVVETRHVRRFTAEERELFTQLTVQAAIAIHNARMFHREQQQNRQLAALLEIGRALTSTLVLEDALDLMARKAAEALAVPRCTILEYDEDVHGLVPRALCRWSRAGGARKARLKDVAAEPLAGVKPWPKGEVLVENAADENVAAPVREAMAAAGESARVSVPLLFGGRLLGVMRLAETDETRVLSADDLELARGIGEQAAAAFQNARLHRVVQEQADTDGLTGLHNSRYFRQRLVEEVGRVRRYPEPLSLLMLDLDDFKRLNDDFGHLLGDEVLRGVARLLRDNLRRDVDIAARYGGEEFVILLPNTSLLGAAECGNRLIERVGALSEPDDATHPDGARGVGERIRVAVESTAVTPEGVTLPRRVTVSIGVAQYDESLEGPEALIDKADAALYRAKRRGKNCVEVAGPDTPR
jgi:diguanylate cyclase (GGDEF)-like protein